MRKNGCVNVGNTEMFYAAFGNGSRKMIVLPGLSDGLATVKGKAWILASSYKCFFKDYTVYMFSRKNQMPEAYTIRDMARDQVEAMKSLGIEKAFVMGVSQGGMIAQYMAIDYPETVEKMYSEKYLQKNRKYFPLLASFTKPANYDRFFRNAYAILKFDARNELSKIMCPTLIIAGSDDRTVGNDAAFELNRRISGSELYIYDGLGHGAFE